MNKKTVNKLVSVWLVFWMAFSPILSIADVPVPGANFTSDTGSIVSGLNGAGGTDMVIQQNAHNAVYNWDSYNIGSQDSVEYQQPSVDSTALNYIHQNSASFINGHLSANGNIVLLNQNGILFGEGAVVDVGGLVASSLDIDEDLLFSGGFANSMSEESPLFQAYYVVNKGRDPDDPSKWVIEVGNKPIEIQDGAQISSDEGRILLVAPTVIQGGSIVTTSVDGQTVIVTEGREMDFANLSDNDRERITSLMGKAPEDFNDTDYDLLAERLTEDSGVYFATSTDPDLRGLFVEVSRGGNATISETGEILAETGNITVMGMAINQNGTLRATTSVDVNGTIRLLARDNVQFADKPATSQDEYFWGSVAADEYTVEENGALSDKTLDLSYVNNKYAYMVPQDTGSVTFGGESTTEVVPEIHSNEAPDAQHQFRSIVDVMGSDITLESGSEIRATGGIVQIAALDNPALRKGQIFQASDALVTIEDGALIDVSGTTNTVLDMSRNLLEVDVTSNELRDSPLQRDGVLKGETVYVDLRGDVESIDIIDIQGARESVQKSISERLVEGGEVNISSTGTVDFQEGATIDVSGGEVAYRSGFISETKLVSESGQIVGISDANSLDTYITTLDGNESFDAVWGVVETSDSFIKGDQGQFVTGYTEGSDAGELNITTDQYLPGGSVLADTTVSIYQRDSEPSGGLFSLNMQLSNSGLAEALYIGEKVFRENLEESSSEGTQISQSFFSNSVDSVELALRGDVTIGDVQLDGGGSLSIATNQNILAEGTLRNAGGNVNLSAQPIDANTDRVSKNIIIQDGAIIDTSGIWVNDNPAIAGNTFSQPILIDGGSINLSAAGSVTTETGSQLIADGGAHLSHSGKLTAGSGGDISMSAGNFRHDENASLVLNGRMQSYALISGGALSLTDRGIQVGGQAQDGYLYLDENDFINGGFSAYQLIAKQTGVEFGEAGTSERVSINLGADNYVLPSFIESAPGFDQRLPEIASGAKLSDFSSIQTLHPSQRGGVDLSVSSDTAFNDAYDSSIVINEGVQINAQPGSGISFSTDASIEHRGSIINKAGDVTMTIATDSRRYDDSQAIRIYESSLIDVSATAVERIPDGSSWNSYDLHDAGNISLIANRGYILAESGSTNLIAKGASQDVYNLTSYNAGLSSSPVVETAVMNAGSVTLQAAEGMLFEGGIDLSAAVANARGGTLNIAMYANNRYSGELTGAAFNSFENNGPAIIIEDRAIGEESRVDTLISSDNVSEVMALEGLRNGSAYVDVKQIDRSGADNVKLQAVNVFGLSSGTDDEASNVGSIQFATDSVLSVQEQLILDAPTILVGDHQANVESNYLAIGSNSVSEDIIRGLGNAVEVAGSFSASANFIDLRGASEFGDAAQVVLSSATDIRLLGRTQENYVTGGTIVGGLSDTDLPTGSLTAYGDVTLAAGQIYPTTATTFDFRLEGEGATFSTVKQGEGSPILSALGTINVSADNVVHAGVFKAPFGQINLGKFDTELVTTTDEAGNPVEVEREFVGKNESIDLIAGSLMSTSAEGQIIPFGEVLPGDNTWAYTNYSPSQTDEDSAGPSSENLIDTLIDKGVKLNGKDVVFQDGATIDVSGGGDIFAYQWTPGLGGSQDILASSDSSFAILPAYNQYASAQWGAFDQVISGESNIAAGTTVYLGEGAGIPAGEYAVLPARYALIPGAFLVSQAGTQGDIIANASRQRIDGVPVVAGRYGLAGSETSDSQWTPFVVEPGSLAFQRSQYDIFYGSEYFNVVDGFAEVALPQDAGRLALDVENSIVLAGNLVANPDEGGIGGSIDISAPELEIVSELNPESEAVQLLDSNLNDLEVESLLLGATRERTMDGLSLGTPTAENVSINSGATLELPEVLMTAKNSVTVSEGSIIRSTTGSVGDGGLLSINGSGAFLQVSDGGSYRVNRTGSNDAHGNLLIEEGSVLDASSSLSIESTDGFTVLGDLHAKDQFAVSAENLFLVSGSDVEANEGVNITTELLEGVGANGVLLKARDTLTMAGDLTLAANQVEFDTPNLVGVASQSGGNQVTVLANESIILSNSNENLSRADIDNGNGTLALESNAVKLQGDAAGSIINIGGFANLQFGSQLGSELTSTVSATDRVQVNVDGNLTVNSDLIIVDPASQLVLNVAKDFVFESERANESLNSEFYDALAGQVSINAQAIDFNGNLIAHSGSLSLNADDALSIGSNAYIDVSGIEREFGTQRQVVVESNGGSIQLTSVNSDVAFASGAVINISAGGDNSNAGDLSLSARNGDLILAGDIQANGPGGRFSAEVGQLADSSALISMIGEAGFSEQIKLRVLNDDLNISDVMNSDYISLASDNGSLNIATELNASGEQGGKIILSSNETITLTDDAQLIATGNDLQNGDGGLVQLFNQNAGDDGGIVFESGSVIDVSSANGHNGSVELITRTPESGETININDGGLNLVGASKFKVLLHKQFETDVINQQVVDDAAAGYDFSDDAITNIRDSIGDLADLDIFSVTPFLEFTSHSNMVIANDISLRELRFGAEQEAGSLLLRSETDIDLNADLHAGVQKTLIADLITGQSSPVQLAPIESESWHLSLVAGADADASNPFEITSNESDIKLAQDVSLVAGTGNIDVYTSGDLELGEGASIKTIGRSDYVENVLFWPTTDENNIPLDAVPEAGTLSYLDLIAYFSPGSYRMFYGAEGGDINIVTGGDVVGNGIDQLHTNWLFRLSGGEYDLGLFSGQQFFKDITTWGIAYERFNQGIGALGGGDISIAAQGDVTNLTMVTPTVGKQVGANPFDGVEAQNIVEVTGGGNILIDAAGDISSTSYLVSDGSLFVEAGGNIGSSPENTISNLISYGRADISLMSNGDVTFNGASNEFMSPMSTVQQGFLQSSFSGWISDPNESSLNISSIGGDVIVDIDTRSNGLIGSLYQNNAFNQSPGSFWNYYSLLPSETQISSLSNDLHLNSSSYLMPSSENSLSLLAQNSLLVGDAANGSAVETVVNNAQLDNFPTVSSQLVEPNQLNNLFVTLSGQAQATSSSVAAESPTLLGDGEMNVIANFGDIDAGAELGWIYAPGKESYIEAGRDIIDPKFRLQNNQIDDVTRVVAGRDITFPVERLDNGKLSLDGDQGILLGGAGSLLVQAGRDINLGASKGIQTTGNQFNAALPDEGAHAFVLSGLQGKPSIDDFLIFAAFKNLDITVEDIQSAGFSNLDSSNLDVPTSLASNIDPQSTYSDGQIAFLNLTKEQQLTVANHVLENSETALEKDLFVYRALLEEIRDAGVEESDINAALANGDSDITNESYYGNTRAYAAIDLLFNGSSTNDGVWGGDINMVFSTVQTQDGGDVHLLTPGGGVEVGLPVSIPELKKGKASGDLGLFAKGEQSSIFGFANDNIDVNLSRIFVLDGGDVMLWSSNGNIDAGKGARTALTIPPPKSSIDAEGNLIVEAAPAINGSGIGGFTTPGQEPGDIFLFAPKGFVDAGEAGIRAAGDLTIVGDIVNADNIDVGGVSVGVPVNSGISAGVAGLGGLASAATDSATESATGEAGAESESQTAFLTVEIIGLGE